MGAYKIETVLETDGSLILNSLPFHAGERVEVTVTPSPRLLSADNPYPLRGTSYRFDEPTEPVALDEWEALQ